MSTGPFDCDDSDCWADPGCPFTCPDQVWFAPLPATAVGDTSGAPAVLSASCSLFDDAPEQTWEFTAPADGTYTFDTAGSAYDTVLYTLDLCERGAARTACNDDRGLFDPISELSLALVTGQTVYVVVDGHGTESGAYQLNVAHTP
jgi:hypothetical protein